MEKVGRQQLTACLFYRGITASVRRMNTNEAVNAAHNLVSGTISMRRFGWFPLRAPLFFFLFFSSSGPQVSHQSSPLLMFSRVPVTCRPPAPAPPEPQGSAGPVKAH